MQISSGVKRYQVVLLSFALGIFAVTFFGVYFIKFGVYLIKKVKVSNEAVTNQPTPIAREYATIQLFFLNSKKNPDSMDCGRTYSVKRAISRLTDNEKSWLAEYAYLALSELLKGPAKYEKDNSYFTLIPEGAKVQRIIIEKGMAQIDFNDKLNEGTIDSCKTQAIRSQITETIMQFPEIKDVVISVNGKREDILQP